jgi:predicted  nucleic acid-binding Zn-ribbon protein
MKPEVQLATIVNQLREATQKAIASLEREIAALKERDTELASRIRELEQRRQEEANK